MIKIKNMKDCKSEKYTLGHSGESWMIEILSPRVAELRKETYGEHCCDTRI